jgi:hypothetical protein
MNKFIEKNRRLLHFCCIVACIFGWMLLIGGAFWFVISIHLVDIYNKERPDILLYLTTSLFYDFILPGFMALAVMQCIRYLFERERKLSVIVLRNGDKILYMYAAFLVVKTYSKYFWYIAWYAELIESEASRLVFIQPFLLPTIAKFLILVWLGQILRRLIPIIEESKTLV